MLETYAEWWVQSLVPAVLPSTLRVLGLVEESVADGNCQAQFSGELV